MQVVVWLLFGATLGLAGFVSHRRTGPMGIRLAEPVGFGDLTVRLPKGWVRGQPEESKAGEQAGGRLRAMVVKERDEEGRQGGRQRRELWVTQERQPASEKDPAYYLETTFNLSDARQESFPFLGTPGVIVTWRGIPHSLLVELDEGIVEKLPDPGLYACAVLPNGLTVTVQVRGAGAYGPTSQQLVRLVADNLKLSDAPSTQSANGGNK